MQRARLHIEGNNRFTGTMRTTIRSIQYHLQQLSFICLVFSSLSVFGQKPEIKSLDKVKGPNGDLISISGSNFGNNANQLAVFFGAAKGTILTVSDQLIEVRVPPGTTYNSVSVINTTNGLIGYSREPFLLSYGGANPFSAASLVGQPDFNAESGLYDLCMCDLDGDAKVDIAAANDNANSISVFPNSSSGAGNINFGKIPILLNVRSIHIKCGDLNGDGKPDLVVSEGGDGNRIFIFQNGSSGIGNFSFVALPPIVLTGRKTKRVEIADLDLDGKPELIVTDQGSNIVAVLQNQSTIGSVSFAASPILITIPGAASTDALAVGDLNGDLIPEILVSQFLTGTSNIFLIPNTSIPGSLSFGSVITRPVSGTITNLKIGDLDGDKKADIAATQLLSSQVSILLNQSTSSTFNFAAPVNFAGGDRPWGIDFGDLDGDGKPDIVVASITQKTLTVLNNNSTTGNLSFTSTTVPTTYINRHVNIGDVDRDGKPDVAFTSIDDSNLGIEASKVSILRNKHCMIPEIKPAGPINICTGFPLQLTATASNGVTYEWRRDGDVVATGPNAFFDVTSSGSYTVRAISEAGTCTELSNAVTVNIGAGSVTGTATATNNGPVCVGSTLQLNINTLTGATGYRWSGPDGFTTTTQNPNIPNFTLAKAGKYTVEILAGTCVAREVSTVVEAIDAPDFTVAFTAPAVFCQGNTKTLSVSPIVSGFTYQWFEKTNGLISGATNTTLVVSSGGEYYYQGSVGGCTTIESSSVVVQEVTPPTVDFQSPASSCSGQQVQFTDQSTAGPGATYLWTFGDGNSSTERNPTHVYATATGSPFNVKLVVSYSGACPSELTKQITITAAPTMTISNPANTFVFCPGESLRLEVLGGFTNYTWSTGATTSFIDVTSAGTYSVQVNESGCTLFDDQVVTSHSSPIVNVLADPQQIIAGANTQLQASGLVSYEWTPTESLSNPSIPNPIASPLSTTVYKVVGPDANGCEGEGTIQISVQGEAVVTKLKPENFFSPNGDASNPFWVVGEIENYPQCSVAIYDDKGVRVFEATPYLNNWDGTFNGNGKQLPDGVYYYIIRCAGEENNPRSGSITLLR